MHCIWRIELLIYLVVLDRNILLIGYSGHALAVADTAFDNNLNIIGYTEKSISIFNPFNLEYFGDESNPNFRGWGLDVDLHNL